MSTPLPALPDSACAYEVYDPVTLEPKNDSTYIRLMELGWTAHEFTGKSILDIGANSGLLSLHAHRLGAFGIHATDVQEPLVSFFSAVVEIHSLPIKVERRSFDELDVAVHAADIVCFMEVLHWLVDQGGSVATAIEKVALLTRETLYLETPWDVREPSIAKKGIITEQQYNIELILRELAKHFEDVQVMRFMTYFGAMKDSKRVLLRARKRRSLSLPLVSLGGANLVQLPMSRGANDVELITTLTGPKVLKRLPFDETLTRLDDGSVETLCGHIATLKDPTLVPPERLSGRYRYRGSDGRDYMLFPFVGRLGDYFPERRIPEAVGNVMSLALAVRRDLRCVPDLLVEQLRSVSPPVSSVDVEKIPGAAAALVATSDVGDLCRKVAQRIGNYDRRQEDAICHGDLQLGNMVLDVHGRARLVDLDLIRTGTPYFDVLTCALFNGVDPESLSQALAVVAEEESRPLTQFDIDFSISHSLGWLAIRSAQPESLPAEEIDRYLSGLRSVFQLSATLK